MSRRRLIIALTCAFYALQVSLLVYWHSLAVGDMRTLDTMISIATAFVLGLIDAGAARYLLQALHRSETTYVADVSTRLELSLEGYRSVAERDEQLAQEVAHAVEEELARARNALAQGRATAAEEHLRTSVDIASQVKPPYCDNVAVAAVLDSKARQCEEANVGFKAMVDVPAELDLPDVEVAAVFFNLTDNALHECEALRAEGVAPDDYGGGHDTVAHSPSRHIPTVSVRASVQAGHLFIEVSNPCRTNATVGNNGRDGIPQSAFVRRVETHHEHGWGTSIVATIARDHGGLAEFDTHGATFVARVMIPLHVAESS